MTLLILQGFIFPKTQLFDARLSASESLLTLTSQLSWKFVTLKPSENGSNYNTCDRSSLKNRNIIIEAQQGMFDKVSAL